MYQKQPNSISKRKRYELKQKKIVYAIAEDLATHHEKIASKNGSLMFKHFILLKRTAIGPHLEWKDESIVRANLLMEYFATIYGETSATTMSEYIESGSFDLKICKDEIRQFAKILLTSNARRPDAIPHILYARMAGTLIHSLYYVYRNIVRISL